MHKIIFEIFGGIFEFIIGSIIIVWICLYFLRKKFDEGDLEMTDYIER